MVGPFFPVVFRFGRAGERMGRRRGREGEGLGGAYSHAVLWLDSSVDEAEGVQACQSADEARHYLQAEQRLADPAAAVGEKLDEVAARGPAHDDVAAAVLVRVRAHEARYARQGGGGLEVPDLALGVGRRALGVGLDDDGLLSRRVLA